MHMFYQLCIGVTYPADHLRLQELREDSQHQVYEVWLVHYQTVLHSSGEGVLEIIQAFWVLSTI